MKIVTGMHRSGTSMVSNLIMEIGGMEEAQPDLIEADQWNENGYFENKEFVILNNSILVGEFSPSSIFLRYPPQKRTRFIRAVMSLSNFNYAWLMLFPGQIRQRALKRTHEMEFLARKFDDQIVKDPRFSLLMNAWRQVTGIEKVLFCFRNPYSVASSLKRRNRLPIPIGYSLWLFHNEQFLMHSAGLPVTYVDYDRFLAPQRQLDELRRIYSFLDKEFDEKEAQRLTSRIIDASLRHHAHNRERLPLRVRAVYDRLLALHDA